MGRNAGSHIMWSHIHVPSENQHDLLHYCQQHAEWNFQPAPNLDMTGAFLELKNHFVDDHGCAEQ